MKKIFSIIYFSVPILCIISIIYGVININSSINDFKELVEAQSKYMNNLEGTSEDEISANQYANVIKEKEEKYNKEHIIGIFLSKTALPVYSGIFVLILWLISFIVYKKYR